MAECECEYCGQPIDANRAASTGRRTCSRCLADRRTAAPDARDRMGTYTREETPQRDAALDRVLAGFDREPDVGDGRDVPPPPDTPRAAGDEDLSLDEPPDPSDETAVLPAQPGSEELSNRPGSLRPSPASACHPAATDPESQRRAERLRRRRTRRRMIRLAVATFVAGIGVGMAAILVYLTLTR